MKTRPDEAMETLQPHAAREPLDILLDSFAVALALDARQRVDRFLTLQQPEQPLPVYGRQVLDLIAGHEALATLSAALLQASQGPMTEPLYAELIRHQGAFTQTANNLFPEDPIREQQLAMLVSSFRASFHSLRPRE